MGPAMLLEAILLPEAPYTVPAQAREASHPAPQAGYRTRRGYGTDFQMGPIPPMDGIIWITTGIILMHRDTVSLDGSGMTTTGITASPRDGWLRAGTM